MIVNIFKHHFQLDHSGAAFWREEKILLIADVHLGKISHFRKHGSAVPQQAILENFDRLSLLVEKFKPKTICFLGDLFHSALNLEWKLFEEWVQQQTAKIVLIVGNHDIISPLEYEKIGVEVHQEWIFKKFLMTHHPETRDGFLNLCGHIHPGFRLQGLAKQHLKLKCFFRSENQLILPAFGEFTGVYLMKPTDQEKVYVCTDSEVIAVSKN